MLPCLVQTTAAQPPVFDALDAVSLRTWINMPYCSTLEGDIFKAANVLSKFTQVCGRSVVVIFNFLWFVRIPCGLQFADLRCFT
jgi:hypothetical protein